MEKSKHIMSGLPKETLSPEEIKQRLPDLDVELHFGKHEEV